jgi:hypothetical protein
MMKMKLELGGGHQGILMDEEQPISGEVEDEGRRKIGLCEVEIIQQDNSFSHIILFMSFVTVHIDQNFKPTLENQIY